MKYYLISPKVDGKTTEGYLEAMFDQHIVMMGWSLKDDLGKKFDEIKKGDFVIVAQRISWKFHYSFVGIVDDDKSFEQDGALCRKLKYFVDLREYKSDILSNLSFYKKQAIKALEYINPNANKIVINDLKQIIVHKMNSERINNLVSLLTANYNLILTGAPGTGKTYLAKQIAEQMNSEVGFVQFHPSYDYTDFVEGLRPTPPDANGNVGFERKDGVFMEFCKKALKKSSSAEVSNFEECWTKLIDAVRTNVANNKLTKIGSWEYGLSSVNSLKYKSIDSPSQYQFTITKDNVFNAWQNKIARPSHANQKDMEDIVRYMKDNLS